MILKRQEDSIWYSSDVIIPAVYQDGVLKLKNNGISEMFFSSNPTEFRRYNKDAFQFYALSTGPVERAFFVGCEGEEKYLSKFITEEDIQNYQTITMWEIFYVYSKRRKEPDGEIKKKSLQYSCLRQCRPDTLFCKCDDCGDYFVITPQAAKFYIDRNLEIPTCRCSKCIQKKRMRYAKKNK